MNMERPRKKSKNIQSNLSCQSNK